MVSELRGVAVHLGNYNGMRNSVFGKGRVQITVESLFRCCPFIKDADFTITDNFSVDGSWEYVSELPFGKKLRAQRVMAEPRWLATTITNMNNMKAAIMRSDKPFFWNVENDSYFFNRQDFLGSALDVLLTQKDISIIHLRGWTDLDARDIPGVPRNLSRYEEVRETQSGVRFYVMEKRPEYALWIPVGLNFKEGFVPDQDAERGKCPVGVEKIGAVKLSKDGSYQRLLTEYWNSYTNHGWIARTADLKDLIERYNPLGERQMSIAFKKHFRAARLDEGAFVNFGFGGRIRPTEEEVAAMFEKVDKSGTDSIKVFGALRPCYEAGKISVPEDVIDVYK